MKKLLLLLACLLMILSLTACDSDEEKGEKGENGENGKSAYELAVEAGFEGTIDEWLLSLVGEKGIAGAGVSSIDLTATNGKTDTYTITFNDGTQKTFNITNGADGEKGETGSKGDKGDTGAAGKSAYELAVEQGFEGSLEEWLVSLVGEKGDLGAEVSSLTKTKSEGLVDTYTIIFSNGTISTFTVTNANGIKKIEKTATSGNMDVYTITMSDGSTFPFTVTNGERGDDGKTAEFRVEGEWLQWKYTTEADTEWKNLYETDGMPAPAGLVSVRFVLNGGDINGSSETIYVTSGTSIELPIPKKHGYTFMGWYENESDEYAVSNTYRAHESTKLFAKWEAGAIITGTKIYNLNDLVRIKDNLDGTYVLMNNIDCDGLALPLIGADSSSAFRGIFEGQGYTISNYTVSPNQYMGLFGYNTGTIRNLNVSDFSYNITNANTSESVYVGGIVGYNDGNIEKCGVFNGDIYVSLPNERKGGLIAGESTGKINNCFVSGNIKIEQPYDIYRWAIAAGVVGSNHGEIDSCFVDATVYAYGYGRQYSTYGGYSNMGESALISGTNEKTGTIKNCVVMGSVLCGNNRIGDISSRSDGSISNCYKSAATNVSQSSGQYYTYATEQSVNNISKSNFYSVSLGWDSSVWDYTNVDISKGIYPTIIQE